ncbi:MAG: hypothetical protein NTY47_02450 [Candidatus Omnitrophica bacterium]|nr:hypothetical protein [Candidatus Omnitrophota bacterium]
MKKNITKKSKARALPKVQKEIKDFLLSEEGKITKKAILKAGMSLALLGVMSKPASAQIGPHTNVLITTGGGGHTSHSSHGSHASHGSHGSHGSASW